MTAIHTPNTTNYYLLVFHLFRSIYTIVCYAITLQSEPCNHITYLCLHTAACRNPKQWSNSTTAYSAHNAECHTNWEVCYMRGSTPGCMCIVWLFTHFVHVCRRYQPPHTLTLFTCAGAISSHTHSLCSRVQALSAATHTHFVHVCRRYQTSGGL